MWLPLVFVLAFCLFASPVSAHDTAEANRLMVEAAGLFAAAGREPSAERKISLLGKVRDNLTAIVARFPSTDLAVKLATGQSIGNISLPGIRKALARALLARPGQPGAPLRVWRGGRAVALAAFFRGGRRALVLRRDGVAAMRDVETGEVLYSWGHGSGLAAAGVSRNRRRILTAGADRSVALRGTRTGGLLETWRNRGASDAVALSPDGRRALFGQSSAVYLIEIKGREVLRTWRHKTPVKSVAFSPGGRRVFMGLADGRAQLADARTGAKLHRWRHRGSGGVTSAAFSPDGGRILTGSGSGKAALRDVRNGKTLHEWDLGYGSAVRAVAFSPDGGWVLTGDAGREVELHDARTGKTLRKWKYGAQPSALAFSPGGRRVLMGFADGAAFLCDLALPGRGERARSVLTPGGGCR